MKTVKEVAELTGVSVRTLHYYDEIGLLKPTDKSDAGYRLYDTDALERLQQILFFREFEIPLKEIKEVMDHPDLDRNQILNMQKQMLQEKKIRMERLVLSIDEILEGGSKMDFTLFNRTEMKEFSKMVWNHMPESFKQMMIHEYGSEEEWKKHYVTRISDEEVQHSYQVMMKMQEDTTRGSNNLEDTFRNRMDTIVQKLADRKDQGVDSFSVKEVIGECGFVMKQIYQTDGEKELMLNLAADYKTETKKREIDKRYGEGTADFIVNAIEKFYDQEQK